MVLSTLDTATWLAAWEHSRNLPLALQPCALLAPLLSGGQAAAECLPLGQRDGGLLALHAALLGPQLLATAHCPQCGEQLELALDCQTLQAPSTQADAPLQLNLQLQWQDYRIHFRLPNSRDLARLASADSEQQARELLVHGCIQQLWRGGQTEDLHKLPEALLEPLAEAMSAADPQAVIELDLSCPACAAQWLELFDIGHFLLESLGQWAERLLDQVHLLAQAYGWSEAQILALSPGRRAAYLNRVLA